MISTIGSGTPNAQSSTIGRIFPALRVRRWRSSAGAGSVVMRDDSIGDSNSFIGVAFQKWETLRYGSMCGLPRSAHQSSPPAKAQTVACCALRGPRSRTRSMPAIHRQVPCTPAAHNCGENNAPKKSVTRSISGRPFHSSSVTRLDFAMSFFSSASWAAENAAS